MAAGHEDWMRVALDEARRGAHAGEVPVGAVVVDGEGRQLGRAHNAPVHLLDPTAHAEVLALRRAAQLIGAYRLPGTTLYSTLEPCSLCLGAAIQARVFRLVYGAKDPKGGAAGSVVDLSALDGLNHQIETIGGILADEAGRLLSDFFAARRT